MNINNLPKGTIVVVGLGAQFGKSIAHKKIIESLKIGGLSSVVSPQRSKKLLFDIESYNKKQSDDMVDSMTYVMGWAEGFKTSSRKHFEKSEGLKSIQFNAGRAGCSLSEIDSLREFLKDEIESKIIEAGTSVIKAMTYGFVDAVKASEQLKKSFSKLEEASKRVSSEPKCGKFHQNLRSQLNTGGIKWMK